ncbi:MAG: murein transglycosylase A [Nitrospinota bacterium]
MHFLTRLIAGFVLVMTGISGCGEIFEPPAPKKNRLVLEKVSFADLPGWTKNNHAGALPAFRKSCDRLKSQPDRRPFGEGNIAGRVADWWAVCAEAARLGESAPVNDARARAFFEKWFSPFRATNNGDAKGLFTGYYEPLLRGSHTRGGAYTVPIFRRPEDLITVDLGLFRKGLKGSRIAGKVVDGELRPYADRAAINAGILDGLGLEIVWVDDPVAAFFLHIQGSGRVVLEDGAAMRLGYAAHNGHPYHAIGRELVRRGILTRENTSLQTIRDWMIQNPGEARALMEKNPSYIFFREIQGDGPIGSQGVVLTPLRSLAVDRRFIPLGIPVWVDTTAPGEKPGEAGRVLQQLFIAQDTGGAIRGPVRGDIFWGTGSAAEAAAGQMKQEGEYFLLLPRSLGSRELSAM